MGRLVTTQTNRRKRGRLGLLLVILGLLTVCFKLTLAPNWRARPFNSVHPPIRPAATASGFTPTQIRNAYHLAGSGTGTIALIEAYRNPTLVADLAAFNKQFQLPVCSATNACLEEHPMRARVSADSGWASETALDVEWAHAIAPSAKLLIVEAASDDQTDLVAAVRYAASRPDVIATSMSWGSDEFSSETQLEDIFTGVNPAASFFASSGDDGHGASWPAASAQVISVGGTKLTLGANRVGESAWTGSGGGVSSFIAEPNTQIAAGITVASHHRAIPDVAYDADPASGYAIYDSSGDNPSGWYIVGGTSAGAPQWAAIKALDHNLSPATIYQTGAPFQDITTGANGSCGGLCRATTGYDTVTGLGTPLSSQF